ncbi:MULTISPECIES: 4a-hydroxytetrahydrobiopterin dehydratase [unclassified Photobacterium]|uniref:4a-hydroxytetrahydrobiopterin dehydratase n=1 Tax=unclassified Photobacterium TaxID=2628852 RepID=UPI000D168A56|nr:MULTISPECIES: 4a-hydroxytetrahydrobiopterin dehydratase [unclassified Photobacterium]PSV26476.1 4a-hydroxytetrahydrobiopterin dehydratase [Photobacterium sp. GB-72]PSV26904.1 4a-hydroxytetrahydrobiopterin dehydratase [Photobacterium sp. GB-56]PSV34695.1 4a-hydroxytetrahydrobiopterin dehydratase [Photobacterium sp. GB-27]PSV38164.1 4a-hydroxytetrahydrobiopterin dehydratase [Photobacterium sp. GB-210]PSV41290.1 4a-hydroxytetrahydrobiopterin dehydratase [Photobacterium sp. GB-36]
MTSLDKLKCEACHSGSPKLSDDILAEYMATLPEWQIINPNGVNRITRTFKFSNYKQAWEFSNKVSQLAEEEFHHPTLVLEWGKVTVTWWTHDIKGIHLNDVICAKNTEKLYLS